MKKTFGSVGIGFHPKESKVLISLMFNFSRFYYMKRGIEEKYLTSPNPDKFPGDQISNIVFDDDTFSNLFFETQRLSISLGIALYL